MTAFLCCYAHLEMRGGPCDCWCAGMGAIGDRVNVETMQLLAQGILQLDMGDFQLIEISNVVWGLGSCGIQCPDTMKHVLAEVSGASSAAQPGGMLPA